MLDQRQRRPCGGLATDAGARPARRGTPPGKRPPATGTPKRSRPPATALVLAGRPGRARVFPAVRQRLDWRPARRAHAARRHRLRPALRLSFWRVLQAKLRTALLRRAGGGGLGRPGRKAAERWRRWPAGAIAMQACASPSTPIGRMVGRRRKTLLCCTGTEGRCGPVRGSRSSRPAWSSLDDARISRRGGRDRRRPEPASRRAPRSLMVVLALTPGRARRPVRHQGERGDGQFSSSPLAHADRRRSRHDSCSPIWSRDGRWFSCSRPPDHPHLHLAQERIVEFVDSEHPFVAMVGAALRSHLKQVVVPDRGPSYSAFALAALPDHNVDYAAWTSSPRPADSLLPTGCQQVGLPNRPG